MKIEIYGINIIITFAAEIDLMKRSLILLLLFVANTTLLVHSAVPHHLHDGLFCEINKECESHSECEIPKNHNHHHNHHDQNHHHQTDIECELKFEVLLPSSSLLKESIKINVIDVQQVNYLLASESIVKILSESELNRLKFPLAPKQTYYKLLYGSNKGLRAPPQSS